MAEISLLANTVRSCDDVNCGRLNAVSL